MAFGIAPGCTYAACVFWHSFYYIYKKSREPLRYLKISGDDFAEANGY